MVSTYDSTAGQNVQSHFGDVQPHAFGVYDDGWIVHLDCVQNAPLLVDFEESKDHGLDLDSTKECT